MKNQTIRSLFRSFSFQIAGLLSLTFMAVSALTLFNEYRLVQQSDLKNAHLFARNIREDLLRGQDLAITEKSLRLLSDDRIEGITIVSDSRIIFEEKRVASFFTSQATVDVKFTESENTVAGTITVISSYDFLLKGALNASIIYISLLFFLIWSVRNFLGKISEGVVRPVEDLAIQIKNSNGVFVPVLNLKNAVPEIRLLGSEINELRDRINNYQLKVVEQERLKSLSQIAFQVSHDIRSPLSALNMMIGSFDKLEEEKRVLLRNAIHRINDITNQLFDWGKSLKTPPSIQSPLVSVSLVTSVIESIVSEKRVQYRDRSGIKIDSDFDEGYGLFTCVNSNELKTVLSNLINNSVESLQNESGDIKITLRGYSDKVYIVVSDNGQGIPEFLLQKLGNEVVTYGKQGTQSGSGLGVFHAKKTIEKYGGKLDIQSKAGVGTLVSLTLIKATAPNWFVEKINLTPNQRVVVLDDDITIHGIWKNRLKRIGIEKLKITLHSFTSIYEFRLWFQRQRDLQNDLFLVDHEFLNQTETGLDVIKDLRLPAILITSHFDDQAVIKKCEELKIGVIPKGLASAVPISIALTLPSEPVSNSETQRTL